MSRDTTDSPEETGKSSATEFEQAADGKQTGFVRGFYDLLWQNKKWWLIPLIASLLLLGLVSWLAASGAAPFIYTLF